MTINQSVAPDVLSVGPGYTPLDSARVVGFPLDASAGDGEYLYRRQLVEFYDNPAREFMNANLLQRVTCTGHWNTHVVR